jgi:hypothetical protein
MLQFFSLPLSPLITFPLSLPLSATFSPSFKNVQNCKKKPSDKETIKERNAAGVKRRIKSASSNFFYKKIFFKIQISGIILKNYQLLLDL